MKTQVLLVAVFLLYEAVSQDVKPSIQTQISNDSGIKGSQLQKVEPVSSINSAGNGGSTHSINNNVKATTPKTTANDDVPNKNDVSNLIGDSMFSRAAYLLTGISVLVLLYFAWKSFSLRRRQTHIHKYGVVASREDLEMTSLGFGSEDEEDDTTHFDIGKHQRS